MQLPQANLDAWVRRYGTNTNSYVLLEGPKSYFTLPGVDGFLAYQIRGGVSGIAGDVERFPRRGFWRCPDRKRSNLRSGPLYPRWWKDGARARGDKQSQT